MIGSYGSNKWDAESDFVYANAHVMNEDETSMYDVCAADCR